MTPAIPAATLILARDRSGVAPDLLMVERAATMVFAAGAMVFPGGRIDPEDREYGERLGVPHGAAIVAAVRETLEETAVAVAIDPPISPGLALALQRALLDGASLATLLAAHGLTLDPSALTAFAHWIPEFHHMRRFDTMFFVAAAPPGKWQPHVGEAENRTAEWLTAAEALRRDAAQEANLIFPTRCNLHRLAQHGDLAAIRDDATRHPIEPVTPWIEERDGVQFLTIPAHLGYPVTREPLESASRG